MSIIRGGRRFIKARLRSVKKPPAGTKASAEILESAAFGGAIMRAIDKKGSEIDDYFRTVYFFSMKLFFTEKKQQTHKIEKALFFSWQINKINNFFNFVPKIPPIKLKKHLLFKCFFMNIILKKIKNCRFVIILKFIFFFGKKVFHFFQ